MLAIILVVAIIVWLVGWDNIKESKDTTQVYISYGNKIYRKNAIAKIEQWEKGERGE